MQSEMIKREKVAGQSSVVSPEEQNPQELSQFEVTLRPKALEEYIGQAEIKRNITQVGDLNYWNWESIHNQDRSPIVLITAFFRSGLLIIFATFALIFHWVEFGVPCETLKVWLFRIDLGLIALGTVVALRMAFRRIKG